MRHRESQFTGAAGKLVYTQTWLPDTPQTQPKALLLVVHGAGEHSGRYTHLAQYFCERGYGVAALDHIGHGKSAGQYGYIDRFSDFVETVEIYRQMLSAEFPTLPMILLGHSMGGLISAQLLLKQQHHFLACILTGPAIQTELEPSPVQIGVINGLAKVLPKLGVLQLDASGVSRDPAVVEGYRQDPLVFHKKMSARLLSELFRSMNDIQKNAALISLPLLVLHGEADVMTAPAGSQFLYTAVSSDDKTLKIYPELFHEILNEPEHLDIFSDIANWCEQQLSVQ